jgi:hypothetical protein
MLAINALWFIQRQPCGQWLEGGSQSVAQLLHMHLPIGGHAQNVFWEA